MSTRVNGEVIDNFIHAQARYMLAKLDYDRMVAMAQTHIPTVVEEYSTATELVRAASEEVLAR